MSKNTSVDRLVKKYKARQEALLNRLREETKEFDEAYERAGDALDAAVKRGAMSDKKAARELEKAWYTMTDASEPAMWQYSAALYALGIEFDKIAIRRKLPVVFFEGEAIR